jgi:phosphoenolpyruvate carboxykinase (GTP)
VNAVDEKLSSLLKSKLTKESYANLMALKNLKLHAFIAESIALCNPDSVFVCTDTAEHIDYMRRLALEDGGEKPLKTPGHTYHFDGYSDQGRDKGSTKYLLSPGMHLGASLNSIGKEEGLEEVRALLKDSMVGRLMIVRFSCLGPVGSQFSISGVQVTDSGYVAHSENLLYRPGYEQFRRLGDSAAFFRVVHSSGALKDHISVDWQKRRVYIDLEDEIVYVANTQYAGNTVGFKKLSLRLAIRKADREGWLAEHMLLMGVHGPGNRVTYFTGAFPSYCGKTSTAMIPGETIIGDDLAYLRAVDGEVRAVNVERGIFGIIRGVNSKDDPEIWKVLANPGEVIFSNILVSEGVPYWQNDGRQHPKAGLNHSGQWFEGKVDDENKDIPCSHDNARYTFRLSDLGNLDPKADDPAGVVVGGVIYGGRDSDTQVPVQQSFDWTHGVIMAGASLESETTAATLGQAGVRTFQPMSNLDFVSVPLGKYINNHLAFATGLRRTPLIFSVNYFIRGKDGQYLTGMKDKYVWVKWMERRVHGDVAAIKTAAGSIPRYEDLAPLFRKVLDVDYAREAYEEQFTLRIPENLSRLDRVEGIYRTQVTDTPAIVFEVIGKQRQALLDAQARFGQYVSPSTFDQG